MADSDPDLVDEVRSFGQYKEHEIDDNDLMTAVSRAKSHLQKAARLTDPDWYTDNTQEEALFWTSMLFSKVQTGALDAKAISVGAVKESELLAHSDGNVTLWYRNYRSAKRDLLVERHGGRTTRTARTQNDGSRSYQKREEL